MENSTNAPHYFIVLYEGRTVAEAKALAATSDATCVKLVFPWVSRKTSKVFRLSWRRWFRRREASNA